MGSPPRVRGKLTFRSCLPPVSGITPACAGKTGNFWLYTFRAGDHPRVCGENISIVSVPADESGITPACAGKTLRRYRSRKASGDHPRVCGENALPLCKTLLDVGSPPRVRGKRISQMGGCGRRGITPACAGKTSSSCRTNPKSGDHPRVCGENILPWQVRIWNSGSPPRVRGKLFKPLYAVLLLWITPACAGKTCLPWRQDRPSWDHPRVCGENYKGRHRFGSFQGSPPRVRGKPWVNPLVTDVSGITPACAGKTVRQDLDHPEAWDHPRVCGENRSSRVSRSRSKGSPPRVRGKRSGACGTLRL